MKLILIVIVLLIGLSAKSQSRYLELIDNYAKSDMYGSSFLNNVAIDIQIEYHLVDSLLTNKNIESILVKHKFSGLHLRSGSLTTIYDRNGLSYRKEKYNRSDQTKTSKQFDADGKLILAQNDNFMELYKYDMSGNLIEIHRSFVSYSSDSTAFSTRCFFSANKWIGKYNTNNQLVSEETHWDNGKVYKSTYSYSNETLKSADYNSVQYENVRKEYIYEDGLLERIDFYNKKGDRTRSLKLKWTIKNEA